MADLAVSVGAASIAHDVHYAVLGIGLLGLVVLLAPGRGSTREPDDAHALRVRALRASVAAGTLGRALPPAPTPARTAPPAPVGLPPATALWLPLAVISSAAAAGVHAAVGPAHFRETTLIGLFFAVATVAQLAWSATVVVRPTEQLLVLGAAGNVALIGLWAVTRTVGLPGVLPGPESVGPWDLACVAWELVTALACLAALQPTQRTPGMARVADWASWDQRARLWAVASVIGLGLLSISGAGS